jgi:hypothetical protein
MMKHRSILINLLAVMLLSLLTVGGSQAQEPAGDIGAQALGTAFTYQGRLTDGGSPANGEYDFQFELYNGNDGSDVGRPISKENVSVTEGLFTVELDFGDVFDGTPLLLGISVRPGSSSGTYTTLSPRQWLTPAPYALYAAHAPWNGLSGVPAGLDDGDDDTTYTAGAGLTLNGGQFSLTAGYRLPQGCTNGQIAEWNGSAWVCGNDDAGGGGSFWSLSGNNGTTPGTHFVGTTDNQALELRVNGEQAFRLEPTAGIPNVIGGSGNSVAGGVTGATIGGGSFNQAGNDLATVSGGERNDANGSHATIGGGLLNTASGTDATVGGGQSNTARATDATVGGGIGNTASGSWATVGGGQGNIAGDVNAIVGGGSMNEAGGFASTVGGGFNNKARADYATIAGGGPSNPSDSSTNNQVYDDYGTISGGGYNLVGSDDQYQQNAEYATIGGGFGNRSGGIYTTVSGGAGNSASSTSATVGGGNNNTASGINATVSGGYGNTASSINTTVGGGYGNRAVGPSATIGGGVSNMASGDSATVGGGDDNKAFGLSAIVGGGNGNKATDNYSTIGGGQNNQAGSYDDVLTNAAYATVGGGRNNTASGGYATICGGFDNEATGVEATIAGGVGSTASGQAASIGGGLDNEVMADYGTIAGGGRSVVTDPNTRNRVFDDYGAIGGGGNNQAGSDDGDTTNATYATISGGRHNTASAVYATVNGGYFNTASKKYATVPGGYYNTAAGDYSFAAGRRAKANNPGCFVWADSSNTDVTCDVDNRWVAQATGGVLFYSDYRLMYGVYLPPGGNSWNSFSDRANKENFTPVDGQAILRQVAVMPLHEYNLKSQDDSVRHIGPVAQDFNAVFGYGESDTAINMEDADGVALAAIQGLYQLAQEQADYIERLETQIADLRTENIAQQRQLDDLEARVAALESALVPSPEPVAAE